jgi:hypothetical protein
MRSSGVCRPQNEQHTTESQSGFTNCKATFRQARSLKRVYSLQRQSRGASGTKDSDNRLSIATILSGFEINNIGVRARISSAVTCSTCFACGSEQPCASFATKQDLLLENLALRQGLKPALILDVLRGAEAPLFRVTGT